MKISLYELRRKTESPDEWTAAASVVVFPNGFVVVARLSSTPSVEVYANLGDVVQMCVDHDTSLVNTGCLDFKAIRRLQLNYAQDVFEGVHGCALAAGGNQRWFALERERLITMFGEAFGVCPHPGENTQVPPTQPRNPQARKRLMTSALTDNTRLRARLRLERDKSRALHHEVFRLRLFSPRPGP